MLMEFEKGGIEVILGGVRAVTPIKPVGTVSDRRDDRGSTYSTNSTYS